jgi:tRNA(Ile)-lysidine synthase
MTTLAARIRQHVERHALWTPGTHVIAALSGGSDSVAQLLLLRDLQADGFVVLAGAGHLDHGLRPTAARDAAFCRALCGRLAVPFVSEGVAVRDLAARWRCSVEAAGRRARYEFLERARVAVAADRIAVAHTLDDQAETVLLRLLRGAGPRGLRGILPVRGAVVRPVLSCTRQELRDDVAARGERWVDDETNSDVGHPRNRVRHELLPLLAARFQPAVTRVLARTAEVAAAEDALLEQLALDALGHTARTTDAGICLSTSQLAATPLALRRRVVRRVLESAGARRAPDLADVDRALAVCARRGPKAYEAAGVRVERFSQDAVLFSTASRAATVPRIEERPLPVPGVVDVPEAGLGCRLTAEGPIRVESSAPGTGVRVVLRADIAAPLVVRSRRDGDRIRPVGRGGSRKLQDLLVDRKVPAHQRDRVPIVTDRDGRIVWVVGHAADAGAVAPDGAGAVIVLSFEQPAAPGSEGT